MHLLASATNVPPHSEASRTGVHDLAVAVVGIATALMFLLLNPFLALFIVALLTLFLRVPTFAIILPASISFAVFFYFREYGVDWYPGGATDDVPQYISMYQSDYGMSFGELMLRFLDMPNGNELLWHIPLWILINEFDALPDTFVFLHYLVIFIALLIAITSISSRYLAVLAIVYFFLIPISLDSISFIWRQQLAFSIFLTGVGMYLVRGRKSGRWLIAASPLMHVSIIFFVLVFWAFEFMSKRDAFANKTKVSIILMLMLTIIPIVSSILVHALDAIGFARIMKYFESAGADPIRVYLLMGIYALPQLAAFYFLRNDPANNLFMMLNLAAFSIVLALPAANAIYDRLLMFSLPLLALHLFRCLMINFKPAWRLPALVFVFMVGVMRVYGSAQDGYGPGNFLAFGHAFDPSMGLIKMLADL